MRHETITDKKNAKNFFVRGFHYAVNALIISVILNFIFLAIIHNRVLHPDSVSFYATNGFFPVPIHLDPLNAPNESSVPLLPSDPPEEMTERELPDNI